MIITPTIRRCDLLSCLRDLYHERQEMAQIARERREKFGETASYSGDIGYRDGLDWCLEEIVARFGFEWPEIEEEES